MKLSSKLHQLSTLVTEQLDFCPGKVSCRQRTGFLRFATSTTLCAGSYTTGICAWPSTRYAYTYFGTPPCNLGHRPSCQKMMVWTLMEDGAHGFQGCGWVGLGIISIVAYPQYAWNSYGVIREIPSGRCC